MLRIDCKLQIKWLSSRNAWWEFKSWGNLEELIKKRPNLIMQTKRSQTCNQLDLKSLEYRPIMPKVLSKMSNKSSNLQARSCSDHTKLSVSFEPWNWWGLYWEIDGGPSLFTLLKLEMPRDGVWTSRCDQPLNVWFRNTCYLRTTTREIMFGHNPSIFSCFQVHRLHVCDLSVLLY